MKLKLSKVNIICNLDSVVSNLTRKLQGKFDDRLAEAHSPMLIPFSWMTL